MLLYCCVLMIIFIIMISTYHLVYKMSEQSDFFKLLLCPISCPEPPNSSFTIINEKE